ncbi:16S rRNA (guanine(966)-N(2))-methyltransferase RsmD [Herbaspirillum sp. YR522]|uniref:16S rRNA (guanine(966)-N(2))-methyltransferase RsmD n=1 Tax=Herbaspirillum sp. YR522 TaxID=1144342 RepID=UPI00026F6DF2|nr:16S rRNA (guanine(966)-N(2))-methyltransferase RsmD [Herbaspirillum sp. YR522]EJN03343.1 RNA methyltransferase, RsmD family [Herbaspirillum sp. YR522]
MKQTQAKRGAGRPAAPRVVPRQVRIIGGQWKRTPLPVLDAEGLRPTPDRVRETVFNWLTHLLDGNWEGVDCLDLFAGSGALGFEAASRGAAQVTMVELGTAAVRQLEATRDKLRATQVSVQRADALSAVRNLAQHRAGRFQLVFVDPPYNGGWLEKMLPLCQPLLAPRGLVYAEAEFALDGDDAPRWMDDWEVLRSDKAGMVFYHLLQRKSARGIEA